MRIRALILLSCYWLAFHYFVFHTPFDVFPAPGIGPVDQVQYKILHDASEFPGVLNTGGWQSMSLPDDWYANARPSGDVWYRSSVQIDELDESLWGLYLPSVTHNAVVYINGTWAGQGGHFSDPVSRHQNEPLLFRFSSDLLMKGENTLDVRVKSSFHEQGLLGLMYLAPYDQLKDAYAWKHFLRVDFIQGVTIAMLLMSVIIFAFWVARPQDSIYGLFSLELLFWAIHNLNLFISDIPVSARLWEALNISTLGWTVVAMLFFNHRYVGKINRWAEITALLFVVVGMALFLLPGVDLVLQFGYRFWYVGVAIFGCYAIIFLLMRYWHTRDTDVFLMLLAGIPILVFGLHDILMINHFIDRQHGLIIQYSVIPPAILFSWFLLRRFVYSINHAEQLAATLEQRVLQKQQQLQEQYEQMGAMQKQQLLSEERERIMRDMHDGIGGQLVSIITLLQEQSGDVFRRIREKLQLSLTDLRLVIDSLDPVLNDLPTLLGMMRLRFEDQLNAAGIKLEWAVTELPEIKDMSPRRSLHIMRIIQEAITNSVKHSGTDRITLATGICDDERQAYIDIIDYGKGMADSDVTDRKGGRGINNMHYRAGQIDAELQLKDQSPGVNLRLMLEIG